MGNVVTHHWVTTISLAILSLAIRVAVVASHFCEISHEILRKFELTALEGNPRSSILVSIESAYATSY